MGDFDKMGPPGVDGADSCVWVSVGVSLALVVSFVGVVVVAAGGGGASFGVGMVICSSRRRRRRRSISQSVFSSFSLLLTNNIKLLFLLQPRRIPQPTIRKRHGTKPNRWELIQTYIHPLLQHLQQGGHSKGRQQPHRRSRGRTRRKFCQRTQHKRRPFARHQVGRIRDSLQEQGETGILGNFAQGVRGRGHAPEAGKGVGELLDPSFVCVGLDGVEQGLVVTPVEAGVGQGREVLLVLVVGGFLVVVGVVAFVVVVPVGGGSLVVVVVAILGLVLVIHLSFPTTAAATTTIIAAAKYGCRC